MIFFVYFGRFSVMNRKLLEPLYPDASKIAPNFWPDYDKRYTSLTPESILQRSWGLPCPLDTAQDIETTIIAVMH